MSLRNVCKWTGGAVYPCHRQRQLGRDNRAHIYSDMFVITAWVAMSMSMSDDDDSE